MSLIVNNDLNIENFFIIDEDPLEQSQSTKATVRWEENFETCYNFHDTDPLYQESKKPNNPEKEIEFSLLVSQYIEALSTPQDDHLRINNLRDRIDELNTILRDTQDKRIKFIYESSIEKLGFIFKAESFSPLVTNYIKSFKKNDVNKINELQIEIDKMFAWKRSLPPKESAILNHIGPFIAIRAFQIELQWKFGIFAITLEKSNAELKVLNSLDPDAFEKYKHVRLLTNERLSFIIKLGNNSLLNGIPIVKILRGPLNDFSGHLSRLHVHYEILNVLKGNIFKFLDQYVPPIFGLQDFEI